MIYQKIWQKTLVPDEKIKYEFSIGHGYCIFGLICGIGFSFLFSLLISYLSLYIAVIFFSVSVLTLFFYFNFYLKIANAYAFTSRRIVIHRGWFSTHVISIDYKQITDIKVIDPLATRILTGTGYLVINTAGTDTHEVFLSHISRPYEVKKKLEELKIGRS